MDDDESGPSHEFKGLVTWIKHRAALRQKHAFDPAVSVKRNWPSLSVRDKREVMQAYRKAKEKENMVPIHQTIVKVHLGWRRLTMGFKSLSEARLFVDEVLGDEKYKWKSSTMIAAKADDVLTVECDDLEEIMELKPRGPQPKIDQGTARQVEQFLTGQWSQENGDPNYFKEEDEMAKKKKTKSDDLTSLQEICEQNGWDPRKARAALRKAGESKEGRWEWGGRDVPLITKKLKGLMQ